jgi:HlyD family secretion protein
MQMKLSELKPSPGLPAAETPKETSIRGTEAQDKPTRETNSSTRKWLWIGAAGGALIVVVVVVWLARAWGSSANVISADRVRIVPVTTGHFVRDVAAQGVVIAAVNPTLYAIAPGTVSYTVHAGDTVTKGMVLATLDSPELKNEYQRERATLDSLNAALARQEIEIRRQILTSQQQADLTQVAIRAAEREAKRAQWAWDQRVISERDYRRTIDDVDTAKLNFDHAHDTAALEKDSLSLELRTKRLERDRQAFVVENLKQRVEELSVRSPVNGMVANLAVAEKTRVGESAALLTVVDLSAFEIEFRVAETYVKDIKPRMPAQITLDGRVQSGVVTAISPEVRDNEVTGRVKFASQPPGLRQNERASVRILLDERDNVLKFERGVAIDENTRSVYVMRGSQAVLTPVELGAASVAEIEVLRGLSAGDRVIISDMRQFSDAPEVTVAQ